MTTDGGGWTLIYEPAAADLDSTELDYTITHPALRADVPETLLAFLSQRHEVGGMMGTGLAVARSLHQLGCRVLANRLEQPVATSCVCV